MIFVIYKEENKLEKVLVEEINERNSISIQRLVKNSVQKLAQKKECVRSYQERVQRECRVIGDIKSVWI